MEKITTYFVSLATYEFHKNHGEYDSSMWEEGSVWSSDYLDEEVEDIFTSLEDARKELATFGNTYMRDYRSCFRIEEHAIKERVYDLDSVYEDFEGEITNADEFVSALKKNPWDFGEYEIMEESESIYDYSPRNFIVEATYSNGERTETEFHKYADAKNFYEKMMDRYSDSNDIENVELSY